MTMNSFAVSTGQGDLVGFASISIHRGDRKLNSNWINVNTEHIIFSCNNMAIIIDLINFFYCVCTSVAMPIYSEAEEKWGTI